MKLIWNYIKAAIRGAKLSVKQELDHGRRRLLDAIRFRQEEEYIAAAIKLRQDACSHSDAHSREALQLVHNYPDGQARGICVLCQLVVHPAEWRIAATPREAMRAYRRILETTPRNEVIDLPAPRGTAYAVPAHPLYRRVMVLVQGETIWNDPIAEPSTTVPAETAPPDVSIIPAKATPTEIMDVWKKEMIARGSDPDTALRGITGRRTGSNG